MQNLRYINRKKDKNKICRKCLNQRFAIEFDPQELIYEYYPRNCPACNNVRQIVVKIPLKAYLRGLVKFLKK